MEGEKEEVSTEKCGALLSPKRNIPSLGSTPVLCCVCPSSPYPISGYSVSQGQGSPHLHYPAGWPNDVYRKIRNQPKYPVLRNLLLCQIPQEDEEYQETQIRAPRSQVHR